MRLAVILRDASLRSAPQDEVGMCGSERRNCCMHGPLGEEPCDARRLEPWPQALAICLTFGAIAWAAHAAGDRELGQYLSAECVTCHQLSGSSAPGIPPIIGKPQPAFIAALNEYRTRQRPNPVMQNIAGKFSQEEIAALAAYFASVKPQPQ